MKFSLPCLILAAALTAAAQAPTFQNARLSHSSASLAAALAAAPAAPSWVGYSLPAVSGLRANCGVEYLDDGGHRPRPAEPAGTLAVLIQLPPGQPARVRTASLPCTLDAAGDPVTWLDSVSPAASAAALSALALAGSQGATAALGMSAGSDAAQALERLTADPAPEKIQRQAVFWLGSARGHPGFEFLRGLESSPAASASLRRQLTFAFQSSDDSGATAELIRMAQHDADAGVRGQAIFWLAHKAGAQAVGAISDAVANDPSTQVKERALLGLSQLPDGQGVPLLIHVAQSNANPAVRKRAIFWLGQSHDPRALDFFRHILLGGN